MKNTASIAAASQWISITDAALALAVSTKTIRRMIARGDLAARRVGARAIRIDVESLNAVGRPLTAPRVD